MSATELEHAALSDNEHFEILGINGESYFVRQKRLGAVVKLRGTPNRFMLAQVAPLTWWDRHFPKRPGWRDELAAAKSFVIHASAAKGRYDEAEIARRRMAAEKRAAQPAPVLTKNGLPAAIVVGETATHFRVKCPHCGDVHVHGARLGPRVPHCAMTYPGIGNYEIVRGDPVRSKMLEAA
ncbi:MAG: hypothetical protein EPN70_05930 [Paraburkholderia sp.]|uniref:hypothetical protein n=1 Tax=Paraburkholderia sp. TaxID=1926495 RepID=UPI0011F55BB2|nr:hypothetical protein [Paraburkholderia sp.]TAM06382.1 MAG: hypothetical protein EPN70_05930 [Paraburkholderia sp.]